MYAILLTMALQTGVVGQCDPVDGPGLRWSSEARAETRARVQAVCEHVGASPLICEYMDIVVIRESSGRPGVRHRLGQGEDGLGAMGLSLWWMRHLWPGDDEDPAFCQPEVSALVALELFRRAVVRWNATNLVGIQAVYAGSLSVWVDDEGKRHRSPGRSWDPGLCARVAARGASCLTPITVEDLGLRVRSSERRELAYELAERFDRRLDEVG